MKIIFYISLFWIIYAYIGYICLLMLITSFNKARQVKDDNFISSVSLIVAAYNEEKSKKNEKLH